MDVGGQRGRVSPNSRLTVALDGTPLVLGSGGLKRYVEELALALAREYPQDSFYLLSDQRISLPEGAPPNLRLGRLPETLLERRWWSLGVGKEARRLGCHLFHGTNFLAPWLPRLPAVVAIHDLTPWNEWRGHVSSFVRRRATIQLRLRLAARVLTPSEAVRRDLIRRFGLPEERVRAIPLAAARVFRPAKPLPLSKPVFVYAGALEPRKNLGLLIEAWREIRREVETELVLIGEGTLCRKLGQDGAPGLRVLGRREDEELARWFSTAAAVLYPSLYEGFGLPVLEAMQCGAVVLASDIEAIREVSGGAALLLDPREPRAWVEAMRAVIQHPESFQSLRQSALKRSAQFDWERTAQRTREVYEQIARGPVKIVQ